MLMLYIIQSAATSEILEHFWLMQAVLWQVSRPLPFHNDAVLVAFMCPLKG